MPWTRHCSPKAPLPWTLLSVQGLLALLLMVMAATGQVPPLPWGRSNTSAALPVSLGSSTQGG